VATARVAQAAFPDGNVYLRLRDELGTHLDEALFMAVSSSEGQPALHPWPLALVSVMPFMEHLSDRQAAQAVRARIDGRYALGLEVTDEGFHSSVRAFGTRLGPGSLNRCCSRPCSRAAKSGAGSKPATGSTDSIALLGAVKALYQLELVGETLRHALHVLAPLVPEWLKPHLQPEGFERDAERIADDRLPQDKTEREALSATIGEDGYTLLARIDQAAIQQERALAHGAACRAPP
jgi:transposase